MILEYHRPNTVPEALALLARPEPVTYPLAGGSALTRPSKQRFAVVDLQALGLNTLQAAGQHLELGACLTLQSLLDFARGAEAAGAGWQDALVQAVEREATYNLRQVATLAGTLVAADGRSPLATLLLAWDAVLTVQPGDEKIELGNLLPVRAERLRGRLITQVSLPSNVKLAYESVARSPADRPIVCAAVAAWPSGRTRLALGGYGSAPLLAMDGTEAEGLLPAAQNAYSQAGDEWASAEYRQEVAGVLAGRCLRSIQL